MKKYILLIIVCILSQTSFGLTQLRDIQVSKQANKTYIDLKLTSPTDYHFVMLANPTRIVLDMHDTNIPERFQKASFKGTPIRNIALHPNKMNSLQIVILLDTPVKTQAFNKPGWPIGYELKLELTSMQFASSTESQPNSSRKQKYSENNSEHFSNNYKLAKPASVALAKQARHMDPVLAKVLGKTQVAAPMAITGSVKTAPMQPHQYISTPQVILEQPWHNDTATEANPYINKSIARPFRSSSKRHIGPTIVIAIDPGHGGKDPGALGHHHEREKDVVLAISKKLVTELNRYPGIHAVLTRNGDYFLSLRERLRVARRNKASFFIAIHADAYKDPYASGASVFALSERGATSEAARWLAEKENYSELGGVDLSDKSRLLRSVLIDLSQTATISQSLEIGQSMLNSLGRLTRLHRGRIEQARFVVLKSPDIPSLLIETGFLSNPTEAQRLCNWRYQQLLARAISAGINDYIQQHPHYNQ